MSGKLSRRKGANFERTIANSLRAKFPEVRRGLGQTRSGQEVCDVEGTPFWIECKRHAKCNIRSAVQQAMTDTDGRPILVITKDDRGPVLVTMLLEDWVTQ